MLNAAPVAVNDGTYNFHPTDTQPTLYVTGSGVLANDTDADEFDTLSAYVGADVSHGSLTLYSDGSFEYTPSSYVGADSFTYYAYDMTEYSESPATVSINVTNYTPAAANDTYSVHHGEFLDKSAANGVLTNDTDGDGDMLTAVLVSDVSHGTLSLYSDGSFSYYSFSDYVDIDSFTYKANDGLADSTPKTVTINVTNTPPVAEDDAYNVHADGYLMVSAGEGVLANDSDPDAEDTTLTAVLVADVSDGTLMLSSDGSFTYSPPGFGWTGTAIFTYEAFDGAESSDTKTVSIFVGNNAPTIDDVELSVHVGGTLAALDMLWLGNAQDGDGDTLQISIYGSPSHGQISQNQDGTWTYTAPSDWTGSDVFNLVVDDGIANSVMATLTFHVVNDAPVAYNKHFEMLHDQMLFTNLADADFDPDGDPLQPIIVTQPENAQLIVNEDGSINVLPDSRFVGLISFTYKQTDGMAESNEAVVTIDYTNTAPVANDVHYAALADSEFIIYEEDLIGQAQDADGDAIWIQDFTQPVDASGVYRGSIFADQAGRLIYTPEPGVDDVTFTFTLTDGLAVSLPAQVGIHAAIQAAAEEVTANGSIRMASLGPLPNAPTVRNTPTTATAGFYFYAVLNGIGNVEYDERFVFSVQNPTFRVSSSEDALISSVTVAGTVYNIANPAASWEVTLPQNVIMPGRFRISATVSFTGDPGDRTIQYQISSASFATPRTASQTIQVKQLAITSRQIVAGYYFGAGNAPIQQNATVRLETVDWTNQALASITPDAATARRLDPEDYQRDVNQRVVTFPILANRASTRRGDTVLRAFIPGTNIEDSVPITVVVPTRFSENNYTRTANVVALNRALGPTTSPRIDEFNNQAIPANQLGQFIAYYYWDTVVIWDQFNSALNSIYAGTDVKEADISINQQMRSDGTYRDPVGRAPRVFGFIAVDNNNAIQAWENGSANPDELEEDGWQVIPADFVSIPVSVAGHGLGELRRRFILTFRR